MRSKRIASGLSTDRDGGSPANSSFILTLKLDDVSFEKCQAWRTRHFPPALNYIPAHLTLLHTASSQQIVRLRQDWPAFESLTPPRLRFAELRYLGRGVAINVESPNLDCLRTRMLDVMGGDFTRQDQQPFRAHITIQNKVDVTEAKALFDSLRAGFEPWNGQGESVLIWKYLRGPWTLESEHTFDGSSV